MLIVGVDFGTTNIRVATWDKDAPDKKGPESRVVASGDSIIMPSVIAFQRNPNGDVDLIVGEKADALTNSPDIQVIPNIKRWAMSSDSYMRWHMDARSVGWPTWWDPARRLVNFWGQEFPVRDIIRDILKQALDTAEITGNFEWRAGCPVHAGFDYRSDLTSALSELAGQGNINWVIEEPLLLLALGYRGLPDPVGSYLIYDLGGGSFDSAMVEIHPRDESGGVGEFVVYGADGHPFIGGADIDESLTDMLEGRDGYIADSPTSMRVAKESLSPDSSVRNLIGGINLTWDDVEAAVSQRGFLRKTPMATRDAYVSAKRMWNRPSIDEVLYRYEDTGEVRFVWQLTYQELSEEIDKIVLYGGATKLGGGWFINKLKKVFGLKVQTASEWLEGIDIPEPELTGISWGACYFADKDYFDSSGGFTSFVNRLPVRITLHNLQTGESVEYKPFDHLTDPRKPFSEFITEALQQEQGNPQEYELSITAPDGEVIEQIAIDGYLEAENRQPATDLRLRVDRYGQVFVDKRSSGPGLSWTKQFPVVTRPPWQTELQRGSIGEGILTMVRDPEYHQRRSYGSAENWRQDTK